MAITKTASFDSPYVGGTFQELTKRIFGGDGYLDGAAASDDGSTITIQPYRFVQNGIVVGQSLPTTVALPSGVGPIFVLAATPDDHVASGVSLTATNVASELSGGVPIAYRANGHWLNPMSLTVLAAGHDSAAEVGKELGFEVVTPAADIAEIWLKGGSVVGPDGRRHVLHNPMFSSGGVSTPGVLASFVPEKPPGEDYNRTDYLVYRQRDSLVGEVVLVTGAAQGISATPPAGVIVVETGTKPSVFHKQFGSSVEFWCAWGLGAALRLRIGASPYATVITGTGNISDVEIVGQRASDNSLIITYVERAAASSLKLVALNPTNGAIINGPTTITSLTGTLQNVQAIAIWGEQVAAVVQHTGPGAAPNQQIYWTTVSYAASTFGTPAITPRLVNGVGSAKNDTWPSIGVEAGKRLFHIAYVTGNSSDEFGELRHVIYDATGTVVSRTTHSTYGYDSDLSTRSVGGVIQASYSSIMKPQIVVTPHDDVYIFCAGKASGGGFWDRLMVFSPQFPQQFGGLAVIEAGNFSASLGSITALAVGASQQGELLVTLGLVGGIQLLRFDTELGRHGRIHRALLESNELGTTGAVVDMSLTPFMRGTWVVTFAHSGSAKIIETYGRFSGGSPRPHSKDVYLAGWDIDGEADAESIPRATFGLFNTRSKKMSHQILVGDGGDYVGYSGLSDALVHANRVGGDIVIRGGFYKANEQLKIASGVSVRGEGLVQISVVNQITGGAITVGGIGRKSIAGIAGGKITLSNVGNELEFVRPGDFVEVGTTFHRVKRILSPTEVYIGGSLSGATATFYACSNVLENLEIYRYADADHAHVIVERAYHAHVRNVKATGHVDGGAAIIGRYCRESTFELVDTSELQCSYGNVGLHLTGGVRNRVESCTLGYDNNIGGQTGGTLKAGLDEKDLRIVGCVTVGTPGSTTYSYDIDDTVDSVEFVGNQGKVKGSGVDLVLTRVATKIRADQGAMIFSDANTGVGSIQLSSPGNITFNGLTSNVIIPSINERTKKAGDTMTGHLIMSAASVLSSGYGGENIGSAGIPFDEVHGTAITAVTVTASTVSVTDVNATTVNATDINASLVIATGSLSAPTVSVINVYTTNVTATDNITAVDITGTNVTGDSVVSNLSAKPGTDYGATLGESSKNWGRLYSSGALLRSNVVLGSDHVGVLDVLPAGLQLGPYAYFRDRLGRVGSGIDVSGNYYRSGQHHIEDFNAEALFSGTTVPALSISSAAPTVITEAIRAYGSDTGASVIISDSANLQSVMSLYATTNGGYVQAQSNKSYLAYNFQNFRTRVKFNGGLESSAMQYRTDIIGYENVYFKYLATSSTGSMHLIIRNENSSSVLQSDIDITLSSVPMVYGAWYWLTVLCLDINTVLWMAGSDDDYKSPDNLGSGLVDIESYGSGRRLYPTSTSNHQRFVIKTTKTATTSYSTVLDVDMVEFWTQSRSTGFVPIVPPSFP